MSGVDAHVEAVKDLAEIARAGIISPPAIKINNRVAACERIPKLQDLATLLTKAAAQND